MNIVVTGSLGNIGGPLVDELIQKGHAVTVISSKAEKKKDIEALGAIAAIGSVDDPEFLASAFAGAEAIFAMVPPNYGVPDARDYYRKVGNSYADALKRSSVKHVVHLSSYGAHLDTGTGFILGSHDVEGIFDQIPGFAVTHLRPGYFYYNFYNFVEMIKSAGFIGTNFGGADRLVMVAPRDIAAAAAEELTSPAEGRKVRYVASDERSADEVARVLGSAIGRPDLKWVTFTDDQTQAGLEANGLPPNAAANLVEIGSSIHTGKLHEDYDLNKPAEMGRVKLEDFAKEFASAF